LTLLPTLFLLLVASAFLSGSEAAFFSLTPAEFRRLRDEAPKVGRRLEALLSDPASLLFSINCANLAVNTGFYVMIAAAELDARAARSGLVGAWTAGGLVALLLGGEILPKAIAMSMPVLCSRLATWPTWVLRYPVLPVTRFLGFLFQKTADFSQRVLPPPGDLSPDEISAYSRASRAEGEIGQGEDALLREVLEFGDIRVREVMTPRVDIQAFAEDGETSAFHEFARKTRKARIPLFRDDLDHIGGYVRVEEALLSPERTLEELRREVLIVPEVATIDKVLPQMIAGDHELAIAVDEYGGTEGLVTVRDILEEIVGNLEPHQEHEEPVRFLGPRQVLVEADLPLRTWNGLFPNHIPTTGTGTIAGFLIESLGRMPAEGDEVRRAGVRWTVRRVRGRRVLLVEAEFLERTR